MRSIQKGVEILAKRTIAEKPQSKWMELIIANMREESTSLQSKEKLVRCYNGDKCTFRSSKLMK